MPTNLMGNMSEVETEVEEEVVETTEEPEVETTEEPPKDETAGLKQAAAAERKKRQAAEIAAREAREEADRIRSEYESKPKDEPQDIDALVDKKLAEREKQRKEQESQQARQKRANDWLSTATEAQARFEDVDLNEAVESVGAELATLGKAGLDLADTIIESDKSWEVIAHLQKNPDELTKLKTMTPAQQGRAIALIESKTTTTGPKVSNAPDPIKPMGSSVRGNFDPERASISEYEEQARQARGGSVYPRG